MKAILTWIAAGAQFAALAMAQPQPRYTVIDLGTLGGTYSFALAINSGGEVAGAAATPAQTDLVSATAVLWSKQNGIINLGTLGPPFFPACPMCNSGASGVGAAGEVAIGSEIATPDPNGEDFCQYDTHRECVGAIWRSGVLTAFQNLPGGNNNNVFWINNRGESTGFAENGVFDPTCAIGTPFQVQQFQPVIWGPNGEIERVLSPLVSKGDTVAYAFQINDTGQVVGASGLCSTIGLPPAAINSTVAARAVLWDTDGSITDLGSLGEAANIPGGINNRGEVVGTAQSPNDGTVHAFLWTSQTGMLDYGAFPGAVATIPGCCHTINDRGEIVGFSVEPDNPYFGRALLWQDSEPKDLNDFVRGDSPFVHLLAANSISDAGEIVGTGVTQTGEGHAFLATPNNGAVSGESVSPSREGIAHPMLPENIRRALGGWFGIRRR